MNNDTDKTRELLHQLSHALETTRYEETEQTAITQNKLHTQEIMTSELKEKIRALETRLQQYLEHAPEKEARARELQNKINEQILTKEQQKTYLKKRLAQLKEEKKKIKEERKQK